MPTYVCTTAARLTEKQKERVVDSLTTIHNEETGAPRYLVQVVFNEVNPGSHFIGGQKAPEGQIWIRADIRSGRTEAVKRNMLKRIVDGVSAAAGSPVDAVWVYLADVPAHSIVEYGQVMCEPGQEDAWFAALSEETRARLKARV